MSGVDAGLDGGLILGNLNGMGVRAIDGDAELITGAQFAIINRQAQDIGANCGEGGCCIDRVDIAEGDHPRPTNHAPGNCQRPWWIGQPVIEHGTIQENTVSQGDRLIRSYIYTGCQVAQRGERRPKLIGFGER